MLEKFETESALYFKTDFTDGEEKLATDPATSSAKTNPKGKEVARNCQEEHLSSQATETSYLTLDTQVEEELDAISRLMDDGTVDDEESAESTPLALPSNQDPTNLRSRGLGYLVEQEIDMRKGQMNDTLAKLRLILGTRNALLKKVVRHSKSTRMTGRAWDRVNDYGRERNFLVRSYCRSRQALIQLGVDPALLRDTYKPITGKDLLVNKDVTEENRHSSKNDVLPWF